jgi:hypothetical protein
MGVDHGLLEGRQGPRNRLLCGYRPDAKRRAAPQAARLPGRDLKELTVDQKNYEVPLQESMLLAWFRAARGCRSIPTETHHRKKMRRSREASERDRANLPLSAAKNSRTVLYVFVPFTVKRRLGEYSSAH